MPRGYYDTYGGMFRYRLIDLDGFTHRSEILAPCHFSSPPLIACAFFVRFVRNEAELVDVQSANNNNVPKEEDLGHYLAPHEFAAMQLLQLFQVIEREVKARLVKEVRQRTSQEGIIPGLG